jgi:hypothetical protein
MKREASADIALVTGEGEREEAVPVPHVGDGRPMARWSGGDAARVRFSCTGSLTSGPRSGFESWREPEAVWAALFLGPAH